ncbi:MAG: uncharacterized protein QOI06_799 [Nocardioidaceae bacterium]|jgi:predicted GNAT family acetyltransferase|nr:uncharacterized protein [Nocardioidaceae bacterium]
MLEVTDLPDEQRFVVTVDGRRAGRLDYEVRGDVFVALHTEIDPAFEGQGLAGILVREVLDRVRDTGLRLRPVCPYVLRFLRKHPEYADLVTAAPTGAGGC